VLRVSHTQTYHKVKQMRHRKHLEVSSRLSAVQHCPLHDELPLRSVKCTATQNSPKTVNKRRIYIRSKFYVKKTFSWE